MSSLYTNIPQDEGTEAYLDAIEAAKAFHIPRNVLRQLFEIVLKCNVFRFDGQIYEQIQGMAMGTKMAPSYANLFMDRFERAFRAQEPTQPLVWKRYIDDILCIWIGTRSELGFLDRLILQVVLLLTSYIHCMPFSFQSHTSDSITCGKKGNFLRPFLNKRMRV